MKGTTLNTFEITYSTETYQVEVVGLPEDTLETRITTPDGGKIKIKDCLDMAEAKLVIYGYREGFNDGRFDATCRTF